MTQRDPLSEPGTFKLSCLLERKFVIARNNREVDMVKHAGQMVSIVLYKDELLVESLTRVMASERIEGGSISGIGVLKNIELGYFDLHTNQYRIQKYADTDYELLSLMGNVSRKDGKPFVHLHAVLGDEHFHTFGGHLFEAQVGVTVEIMVNRLGCSAVRELDQQTGLALISRFE